MPGFKLSKKAIEIYEKNKDVEAMLLVNHGYFTHGVIQLNHLMKKLLSIQINWMPF